MTEPEVTVPWDSPELAAADAALDPATVAGGGDGNAPTGPRAERAAAAPAPAKGAVADAPKAPKAESAAPAKPEEGESPAPAEQAWEPPKGVAEWATVDLASVPAHLRPVVEAVQKQFAPVAELIDTLHEQQQQYDALLAAAKEKGVEAASKEVLARSAEQVRFTNEAYQKSVGAMFRQLHPECKEGHPAYALMKARAASGAFRAGREGLSDVEAMSAEWKALSGGAAAPAPAAPAAPAKVASPAGAAPAQPGVARQVAGSRGTGRRTPDTAAIGSGKQSVTELWNSADTAIERY